MREIMFRGKRLDNGAWETGSLVIVRMDCHDAQYYIADKMTGYHTHVRPSTIGQYTGLKDKNGKRIFEGDIVQYQFDNDDCPFPKKRTDKIIGKIFFSDFRASFSVTAGRNGSDMVNNDLFKYVQNGNRVGVIGNIHDNPELLKGGEG